MQGDTELERLRSLVTGVVRMCGGGRNMGGVGLITQFGALYAYPVCDAGGGGSGGCAAAHAFADISNCLQDETMPNLAWNKHFLAQGGIVLITLSDLGTDASNECVRRALRGYNSVTINHYSTSQVYFFL